MKRKNLTAVYFLGSDGSCGIRHLNSGTEEELVYEIRQLVGGEFKFLPAGGSDVNILACDKGKELDLPKNPFIGGVYGSAVLLRRNRRNPYKLEGFDEGQFRKLDDLFEKKRQKIREAAVKAAEKKEQEERA